jgi:hypothetical protein
MIPKSGPGPRVGLVLEEELVLGLDHLLQEPLGLLGVQDREGAREPDRLAEHPQRPVADRVERPPQNSPRLDPGQLLDAVEHLLRRLVREGEKKDLARADPWERSHATR